MHGCASVTLRKRPFAHAKHPASRLLQLPRSLPYLHCRRVQPQPLHASCGGNSKIRFYICCSTSSSSYIYQLIVTTSAQYTRPNSRTARYRFFYGPADTSMTVKGDWRGEWGGIRSESRCTWDDCGRITLEKRTHNTPTACDEQAVCRIHCCC